MLYVGYSSWRDVGDCDEWNNWEIVFCGKGWGIYISKEYERFYF